MERQDAGPSGLVEPPPELDRVVAAVLAAAIEVHRHLGPGFLEGVYERALCAELAHRGIAFERQAAITVAYKGLVVGDGRIDLLVEDRVLVELKAVEALQPVHGAQLRSYLKATKRSLGLLINFNVPVLLRGVRRIVLTS